MQEPAAQIEDDVATNLLPQPGDIALEAADGKISGPLVYVENVDCITYWRDPSATVSWSFAAPTSGRYTVFVTCVHGNGPSEYEVAIGGQKFIGKIAGTGADPGWSYYQDEAVGSMSLVKDRKYEVAMRAASMPKGPPMNLRRILLHPLPP
jgi:hypothetical protein